MFVPNEKVLAPLTGLSWNPYLVPVVQSAFWWMKTSARLVAVADRVTVALVTSIGPASTTIEKVSTSAVPSGAMVASLDSEVPDLKLPMVSAAGGVAALTVIDEVAEKPLPSAAVAVRTQVRGRVPPANAVNVVVATPSPSVEAGLTVSLASQPAPFVQSTFRFSASVGSMVAEIV